VRIEGNNGAQKQDLQGTDAPVAGSSRIRPADQTGTVSSRGELAPSRKSLAEHAAACEEINSAAVAEARELLEAGLLDTPEAARRAAEMMIDRGL